MDKEKQMKIETKNNLTKASKTLKSLIKGQSQSSAESTISISVELAALLIVY